jgi:hypothetical protein
LIDASASMTYSSLYRGIVPPGVVELDAVRHTRDVQFHHRRARVADAVQSEGLVELGDRLMH